MPLGPCSDWEQSRFIPAESVIKAYPELIPCPGDGVAKRYRVPGYAGSVGLICPMSHRFCGECNRIRVTADGKLKPCLHSIGEIPLKGLNGDDLRSALKEGIQKKPQSHHMEICGSETDRTMNCIGG